MPPYRPSPYMEAQLLAIVNATGSSLDLLFWADPGRNIHRADKALVLLPGGHGYVGILHLNMEVLPRPTPIHLATYCHGLKTP